MSTSEIAPAPTIVAPTGYRIRETMRPGDFGELIALHGRVYGPEYDVDPRFEGHVATAVAAAAKSGFPGERDLIRMVEPLEAGRGLAGSAALTDEGEGTAMLRWVVLERNLRGGGLGRALISTTIADARRLGYRMVALETFSDLTAAAAIYRSLGFALVSEDHTPRFGREAFNYQRYELRF